MKFRLNAAYYETRFEAARAFPDSLGESIDTFEIDNSLVFETSYLAGFYADGGNVGKGEYTGIVEELVHNDISESQLKYEDINVKMDDDATQLPIKMQTTKALLPVWLITHRKGNRVCYAAINGENGNVAAQIPVSKGRYIKFSFIAAALIALIMDIFLTIIPRSFLIISEVIIFIFGIFLRKLKGDVYIRENSMDDIGMIGIKEFRRTAQAKAIKK